MTKYFRSMVGQTLTMLALFFAVTGSSRGETLTEVIGKMRETPTAISTSPDGRYALVVKPVSVTPAKEGEADRQWTLFLESATSHRNIVEVSRDLRNKAQSLPGTLECYWDPAGEQFAVVFNEFDNSVIFVYRHEKDGWRQLALPDFDRTMEFFRLAGRHQLRAMKMKSHIDAVGFGKNRINVDLSGAINAVPHGVDVSLQYSYAKTGRRWVLAIDPAKVKVEPWE